MKIQENKNSLHFYPNFQFSMFILILCSSSSSSQVSRNNEEFLECFEMEEKHRTRDFKQEFLIQSII